ncbi:MAG TPA: hypothetical protein VFF73_15195, partial [Planctomycetota bacterium]|nr:hypothetical protein [Planctomycetota bacterium]
FGKQAPTTLPFDGVRLEQLRVTGIVFEPGFARAVIQRPDGQSRVVMDGDKLTVDGPEATVVAIERAGVQFESRQDRTFLELSGAR